MKTGSKAYAIKMYSNLKVEVSKANYSRSLSFSYKAILFASLLPPFFYKSMVKMLSSLARNSVRISLTLKIVVSIIATMIPVLAT